MIGSFRIDPKRLSLFLVAMVVGFIVYQTNFPFHFRFDIWTLYRQLRNIVPVPFYYHGEWTSFSDAASNLLLFIPLGLVLANYLVLHRPHTMDTGYGRAAIVGLAGVIGLSFSSWIEALQILAPDRWTSASDLVTNGLGALVGAGLYVSMAKLFAAANTWIGEKRVILRPGTLASLVYVATLSFYYFYPFIFSVHVFEIYERLSRGRIDLNVFGLPEVVLRDPLRALAVVVLLMPMPLVISRLSSDASRSIKRSPLLLGTALLTAGVLEFGQILVYTKRQASVSLFIVGCVGVIIGYLLMGLMLRMNKGADGQGKNGKRADTTGMGPVRPGRCSDPRCNRKAEPRVAPGIPPRILVLTLRRPMHRRSMPRNPITSKARRLCTRLNLRIRADRNRHRGPRVVLCDHVRPRI